MSVRPATHAGSWYPASPSALNAQLNKYIHKATELSKCQVPGARILVGPHAGYSYCGTILAQSYKAWDTSKVKTVFVFSPSHYKYFEGSQVTKYSTYATPLGEIPVNTQVVKYLVQKYPEMFKHMSSKTDNQEHGLEMHMPMLYKVCQDLPSGVPSIVPIVVCDTDPDYDRKLGIIMAEFMQDETNSFIVSSDFCHWGARFDYTYYVPGSDVSKAFELSSEDELDPQIPIYKSIETLDKRAMQVATGGSYSEWNKYFKNTGNTICGRKPLGIMISALETYNGRSHKKSGSFSWIGYTQSEKIVNLDDSSVSYASGYVTL